MYVPDNEDIRRAQELEIETEYVTDHKVSQINRRRKKHAHDWESVEHSIIERVDEDEYII
jgi:hypothetical protein